MMVLNIRRVVMMKMMRDRVLHGRVPAAHPGKRIASRQRTPLLPTAVGGADDPGQLSLGPQRPQVQGRPPGQAGDHLELRNLRVVVRVDGGVRLAHAGSLFYGNRKRLRRGAVLVPPGAAAPVRDGGGAPVAPGHGRRMRWAKFDGSVRFSERSRRADGDHCGETSRLVLYGIGRLFEFVRDSGFTTEVLNVNWLIRSS